MGARSIGQSSCGTHTPPRHRSPAYEYWRFRCCAGRVTQGRAADCRSILLGTFLKGLGEPLGDLKPSAPRDEPRLDAICATIHTEGDAGAKRRVLDQKRLRIIRMLIVIVTLVIVHGWSCLSAFGSTQYVNTLCIWKHSVFEYSSAFENTLHLMLAVSSPR